MGLIQSLGGSRYAPAFNIDMDTKGTYYFEQKTVVSPFVQILAHNSHLLNYNISKKHYFRILQKKARGSFYLKLSQ